MRRRTARRLPMAARLNSTVRTNPSLLRSPNPRLANLPVELADLIEVRAHAGAGKFRIMRLDRLEDRKMRIEGEPVLTGIAQRHASLVDEPIDDRTVHGHID